MVKPHEPGVLSALGKRAGPRLTSLLAHGPLARAARHLETYLGVIQGKGSGTGWDLAGEVRAALLLEPSPAALEHLRQRSLPRTTVVPAAAGAAAGHALLHVPRSGDTIASLHARRFGSGNLNSRTFFHDFWDELHPLGYRLQRIGPGGVLLPVDAYYEDLEYFRGVSNYLAALR